MKILVAYKRVVDYNVRIQVKPDGSGVVTEGVKLSPNPFDDIALEEALRLREKGVATDVVVATIGPADAQAHLRNGVQMAFGKDLYRIEAVAGGQLGSHLGGEVEEAVAEPGQGPFVAAAADDVDR